MNLEFQEQILRQITFHINIPVNASGMLCGPATCNHNHRFPLCQPLYEAVGIIAFIRYDISAL